MEIDVNEGNFDKEVIKADLPVLVDFWASWCGPCMALGPVISHTARHFAGKLQVCNLNVDESPEIAQKYHIQSIPTIIVFKKGKEVERMVGLLPKKEIEDTLKKHIDC